MACFYFLAAVNPFNEKHSELSAGGLLSLPLVLWWLDALQTLGESFKIEDVSWPCLANDGRLKPSGAFREIQGSYFELVSIPMAGELSSSLNVSVAGSVPSSSAKSQAIRVSYSQNNSTTGKTAKLYQNVGNQPIPSAMSAAKPRQSPDISSPRCLMTLKFRHPLRQPVVSLSSEEELSDVYHRPDDGREAELEVRQRGYFSRNIRESKFVSAIQIQAHLFFIQYLAIRIERERTSLGFLGSHRNLKSGVIFEPVYARMIQNIDII
nr:probable glycosyltransferase At5g03795 [Ipomoea batatas]